MQYQYRQANSCTSLYHPADFLKWALGLIGNVGFFLLVGIYSITVLTLQLIGFLVKNAPKFIIVSSFYIGLALLCIVLSSVAMGYMLMALLSGLNINV